MIAATEDDETLMFCARPASVGRRLGSVFPRPSGKQARRASFYARERMDRPRRAFRRQWELASAAAVETGEGFTITDPRTGCRLTYIPSL